jgi:riboflavin synthase
MFTGIITDLGHVHSIKNDSEFLYEFSTKFEISIIKIGASICCSGVCLTVIDKGKIKKGINADNWFAANISKETIDRTTIGEWEEGSIVNFELALKIGDELGGHIVSGHVDGVAELTKTYLEGKSQRMTFKAPNHISNMIAEKGSIALDGVSLTVNEVRGQNFDVNIIPHSLAQTTMGRLGPGARVNLEIDMLARYVARLIQPV